MGNHRWIFPFSFKILNETRNELWFYQDVFLIFSCILERIELKDCSDEYNLGTF